MNPIRSLSWLLVAVLVGLAAVLAVLTMSAFASLSSASPLWLRSLGALEVGLYEAAGLRGVGALWRAVGLAALTSLLFALAAYIKPRS